MAEGDTSRQTKRNPWQQTTATVVSCSYHYAKWLDVDLENGSDQSYFVTTFSYKVNGELFVGEIDPDQERNEGETFNLLYDPLNPQVNTAEKAPPSRTQKILHWAVGAVGVALLLFLSYHYGWSTLPDLP